MRPDFRIRLHQGPILCDGAMGTMLDLYEYPDLPHELQNVKNPDIVERIHREYIAAGAEVIQTNTFSANRIRLADFHLEDRVAEINRAGVEVARLAAGDAAYVAGSVGPSGKLLEPVGKLKRRQARDAFREQIEALLAAGVDMLMLETFVSLQELDEAIAAAKELTSIPIIAQKTFPEDGAILSGTFPLEVVEHLMSQGVDVVGANCTVGPQRMFSLIRSMYKDGVILAAQPAAGIPTLLNGRSIYHATPEYLAQYARELLQSGVTLIGACCGSTPAHIHAMKVTLEEFNRSAEPRRPAEPPAPGVPAEREFPSPSRIEIREPHAAPPDDRSRFARNVGKKFLVSVELDVPRGLDMSSVIEGAKTLKRHGVDAINITDGARARLRMNPAVLSYLVQREAGIEAMMHVTTRDRNMLGLQSDLMGAHALGIRNVLIVTGDPTRIGDYPQAQSVFDIDSTGLIRAAAAMNAGKDLMGNALEQHTSFFIACALNATAANMDMEFAKLEKKVASGAHIVYTQPIYERKTLDEVLRRIEPLHTPLMVGLLPLRSAKHAEFLHNEIPGMFIPAAIRKRLRDAGASAPSLGIELATEFLTSAKDSVAGAYLMPPFKKYDAVPMILRGAGIPGWPS
jgi:methionine synthase I (cobalamin-dependent)/5,10-methylenetetrahydrofolate reductase